METILWSHMCRAHVKSCIVNDFGIPTSLQRRDVVSWVWLEKQVHDCATARDIQLANTCNWDLNWALKTGGLVPMVQLLPFRHWPWVQTPEPPIIIVMVENKLSCDSRALSLPLHHGVAHKLCWKLTCPSYFWTFRYNGIYLKIL
jgi:hypothetical protein